MRNSVEKLFLSGVERLKALKEMDEDQQNNS